MDGDSYKSALFQLHILFYITQIVLMAILAPVAFLVGLASILSRSSHLGLILPIILMIISVSTSYPRPNPFEPQVVAMVIFLWWLYLGDFALVILRSINIIDHILPNTPCSSNLFIWYFGISCLWHLVFEFFNCDEFFNYNKIKYHVSWSTAGCPW